MPTQATFKPCRFAASAKRIGNRPLPASKPIGASEGAEAPSRISRRFEESNDISPISESSNRSDFADFPDGRGTNSATD
jgi:hypothetical protein